MRQLVFCTDGSIDNIKIITSRSNGDGISLQSCQNIVVKNCFARTWDDTLVVKNYPDWDNTSKEGTTKNITFENCVLWTDLAQSMEVGYETVGTTLTDVTFKNITVLHNFHCAVMSIHNGNNAAIRNVKYDGVTVEDAQMGKGDAYGSNHLFEFTAEYSPLWSDVHKETALGDVKGVSVNNVTVLNGNDNIDARIAGSVDSRAKFNNSTHTVSDVTFSNVWCKGQKFALDNIDKNQYTSQISLEDGVQAYTVPFVFSKTEEQLKNYTDTATVSGGLPKPTTPAHTVHNWSATGTDNGDGTHRLTCDVCAATKYQEHLYNNANVCSVCGNKKPTPQGSVTIDIDAVTALSPLPTDNTPLEQDVSLCGIVVLKSGFVWKTSESQPYVQTTNAGEVAVIDLTGYEGMVEVVIVARSPGNASNNIGRYYTVGCNEEIYGCTGYNQTIENASTTEFASDTGEGWYGLPYTNTADIFNLTGGQVYVITTSAGIRFISFSVTGIPANNAEG